MKNDNHATTICIVCFIAGRIAPWLFLISAALISLLSTSDYWGQTAAWLAAIGLLIMALSYIFAWILNTVHENHRHNH